MEEDSAPAGSRSRGSALALILAGGTGSRMKGLTQSRAKPAVPFGGHYRTIDFTLSNCINSDLRRIALLTQYKSQSLIRHIQQGWSFLRRDLGEFIEVWPAQQRCGERWYAGTVDAVHQNRDLIEALNPEHVLVLAGDHVYAMDYSLMLQAHAESGAEITVGCVEVPVEQAGSFGIVGTDRDFRVRSFVEKPEHPPQSRGRQGMTLASMGIYVFNRQTLFEWMERDAADPSSSHDFGYSVLPEAISSARVFAYVFRDREHGGPAYWRDVGTVDSYWSAHMELLEDGPGIALADPSWPVWTHTEKCAPARISSAVRVSASIIGQGSDIAGDVHRSVVSTNCRVGAHSRLRDCVLLPDVTVGRNCSLERVVVDSRCVIPDNTVIGSELFEDGGPNELYVSPGGVVLVTRPDRAAASAGAAGRKVA